MPYCSSCFLWWPLKTAWFSVEEASIFDWKATGGPTISDGTRRFLFAFGAFSSYSIEMLFSPTWVPELKGFKIKENAIISKLYMYALLFVMLPLMATHNCVVFTWRSFNIRLTGHRWSNNQPRNSVLIFRFWSVLIIIYRDTAEFYGIKTKNNFKISNSITWFMTP